MSGNPHLPVIDGLDYLGSLGSGGYADVHLFEQQVPRRRVAVKVMRNATRSATDTARFTAEANAMAQLEHPHIVPVYSAGTTADGRPYLVMMYYPRASLAERVKTERMSVAEVLRIGIQISAAVETAHRAGLLHRDIKPANILTSQYGSPGLTDFGIAAQISDADDEATGVSVPWSPVETLYATAPASVRSDVYSLAATLWHLLVGRSAFEVPGGDNSTFALMRRVRDVPPPSTGRPDVPTSLDRLLRTALAKQAQMRPESALTLARSLQSIEQELRLPRTEIVVAADAAAPRPADTRGAAVRARAEDDRTRLRGPQRVVGQQRGPAGPPFAGVSGPVSAASSPTGGSHASSSASKSVTDGTGRRGDPAKEAETVLREPGAHPGHDQVLPATVEVADHTETGGSRRRGLGIMIGGGVAVVALAAMVVLTQDWGGSTGEPTTTDAGDPPPELGQAPAPGEPVVLVARDGDRATFTWTYDNPLTSDTYLARVNGDQPPRPLDEPTLTLDGAAEQCVAVKVLRSDGAYYPREYSEEVCG
ncbi:MAG: serine/threonine-protein kinase [Propioniciclava sp.]